MMFFFDPGRSLSTAIVALFFSGLWLAVAIKHHDTFWALVAGGIAAASLFTIFHSTKWCIRKWRVWLD